MARTADTPEPRPFNENRGDFRPDPVEATDPPGSPVAPTGSQAAEWNPDKSFGPAPVEPTDPPA
ncbi:hypothetical protein [Spirillospora sp. CA-128828]|uniref:hypothetical protein n=1 Tax=Spirillospora sp. CA-128828 TaxID=3240033 RepID=UPI003D8BF6D4